HINQDIIDKVRLKRISDLVKKREKVTIRDINMKDFQNEVKRIKTLYNEAWEMNWGFVPMTDKEFDALADGLKQVVDPELVYIVENQDGKPIGFSLSLPDMNIPFKHVNGNPLTPWGLAKFLWYKRNITMLRTITMGVIPSYRNKGIDSIMNSEIVERAKQKGIYGSEMSWVLKCNEPMTKLATAIGGEPYKEYAIYEIDI
ncbi:MAG: GNAT family N-acetyltransferase, partial [Chlorobiales bacterium]|nr:GNAT family N-acetyltransferase [Chlorobiales bacterium]